MRTVWVSFDTIGHDCLEAAAEVGAEIVGVVTLPGPIDPNRSGQCSFDEVAALIDRYNVNFACVDHLPEGRLARGLAERRAETNRGKFHSSLGRGSEKRIRIQLRRAS